jgi:hypothetical protein
MADSPVSLRRIKLSLKDEERRVRLLLQFEESTRQPDIEIEMGSADVMALMVALKRFQANHHIPIPPNLRPQGPPLLSIVSDDGTL